MLNKLHIRLLVAFSFLVICPIVGSGIIISIQIRELQQQHILSIQREVVQGLGEAFENYIHHQESALRQIVQVRGLQGLSVPERSGLLAELLAFDAAFEEITLLNYNGDELVRHHRFRLFMPDDLENRSAMPDFRKAASTGGVYFGPVHFDTDTGEPLLRITVPIRQIRTGRTEGFLMGLLRLKPIWDLLANLPGRQGQQVFILDSRARVVAHPNPSIVLRGTTYRLPEGHFAAGLSHPEAVLTAKRIPIGEQLFTVVAERSRKEAFAVARNTLHLNLMVSTLVLLMAVLLMILMFRQFVRPVKHLVQVAQAIEGGDISRRARIKRKDEVGQLADAFNRMTDRIDRSMAALDREIAERRETEEKLRQSRKMEAIGTLAGGIAHDFNNILGIVVGNTELAMEDVPRSHPAHASLQEVLAASLRARDVVRQLLSFARKTDIEKVPVDIAPLVKAAVKLMRASIPATIEIRTDIPQECRPIMADPAQINQIVINLCANAAHAMPEGGQLRVALENKTAPDHSDIPAASWVELTVSDTGTGIPPEHMDRIFDPYFTTKAVGKGTGMGLAVVHGIVQGHNGTLRVTSSPDRGTAFRILLPVVEGTPAPADELRQETPMSGNNETILYVDDEPSMTQMARMQLERLGYRVETRSHPREALELIRDRPDRFDLVITDMTMPDMTGDKLIAAILVIRPDIPVILCTGYHPDINEETALEIGAAGYLEKPLNKTELAATIRRVLDGR